MITTETTKVYEINRAPDGCWMGSNYRCMSSKELTAALRAEFRANGIKGVTVSFESYTGGRTINVKITPTEADFTPLPEYLEKMREPLDFSQFSFIEDNGKRLNSTDCLNLPPEERYSLYARLCTERYNHIYETGNKYGEQIFGIPQDEWDARRWRYKNIFTEAFLDKLRLVEKIVDSYNYDESDPMTDYFSRGFCDFFYIMPRKKSKAKAA